MRTRTEVNAIKMELFKQIGTGIDNYANTHKDKIELIKNSDSLEDGLNRLAELLGVIEAIIKGPTVQDVCLPAFISKIETTDTDKLTKFTLSIRSKIKAAVKCKREREIYITDDLVIDMASFMLEVLFEMYMHEMALENINALNVRITQICLEAGIKQRFWFTVSESNTVINYIDDDKVIFNADIDKALDIHKQGIFLGGDEYTDLVCKEAKERLVSLLKTCETTPQIVKSNIGLIKDVTGMVTKKRASKLIREAYHRNIYALLNLREGIGYYEDIKEIDGEEVKIFSLIKKENGNYCVILKPFDEVSLFNIDFDVLSEVGITA